MNKEGPETETEIEIAVRLQLRVECKLESVLCMVWCGCHGERKREKEDRRKTDAGFLLSRNATRCSRVNNLGLASSIAMAGKRTRGCMYFVVLARHASLQEGGRAGGSGCALRSANWAVSTFDNNRAKRTIPNLRHHFFDVLGWACMYLSVVRSNKMSCGQARGGT